MITTGADQGICHQEWFSLVDRKSLLWGGFMQAKYSSFPVIDLQKVGIFENKLEVFANEINFTTNVHIYYDALN